MLKIKDKNGKTIMVLKDDASEPELEPKVRAEEIKTEEEAPVEETEEKEEGEEDAI